MNYVKKKILQGKELKKDRNAMEKRSKRKQFQKNLEKEAAKQ